MFYKVVGFYRNAVLNFYLRKWLAAASPRSIVEWTDSTQTELFLRVELPNVKRDYLNFISYPFEDLGSKLRRC